MTWKTIAKLTREKRSLIRDYQKKWDKIALSTDRIDKDKAALLVKEAYDWIGLDKPEVIFCDSPYAALINIIQLQLRKENTDNRLSEKLKLNLYEKIEKQIYGFLKTALAIALDYNLYRWFPLQIQLEHQIDEKILNSFEMRKVDIFNIYPVFDAADCKWLDFCISVLECEHEFEKEWKLLQSIVENCNWLFAYREFLNYQNLVIIIDRPTKLLFDNQNNLHAEGEPAIQFADGYSLYAYHGVTLPEQYGKLHPNQWQAKWLLEESNAELRRVLIQGMGYHKICQELHAIELDSWQEYTLLKIDNEVDIELIYLLKMTCPSTGSIHILRVPPSVKSAREAICWVNWGIDPLDFYIQT
jgi:hypothetical protein